MNYGTTCFSFSTPRVDYYCFLINLNNNIFCFRYEDPTTATATCTDSATPIRTPKYEDSGFLDQHDLSPLEDNNDCDIYHHKQHVHRNWKKNRFLHIYLISYLLFLYLKKNFFFFFVFPIYVLLQDDDVSKMAVKK